MGGYVTPLNVSIMQPTGKWQIFYGNSTEDYLPSWEVNISNSSGQPYSTNISLGKTVLNYWASDSPAPTFANLQPANLTQFDSQYGLVSHHSASFLFNETVTFNISDPYGPSGSYSITGPTVYFQGLDPNGSFTDRAYVQALFQSGNDFLFLVPVANGVSLENRTNYSFIFILPYYVDQNGTLRQFHLFSTYSNVPPPSGYLSPVPYRWSYDQVGLSIYTVPYALVQLRNSAGYTISDSADNKGFVRFSVLPGTYTIILTASSYSQVEESITLNAISEPIVKPTPENATANATTVNFSVSGNATLCSGGECYVRSAELGSLPLNELDCTGSFCVYSGENVSEFIKKYDFQPSPATLTVAQQQAARPPVPTGDLFAGIGRELSSALGGATVGGTKVNPAIVLIFAFVAAAGIVTIFGRFLLPKNPRMGHD